MRSITIDNGYIIIKENGVVVWASNKYTNQEKLIEAYNKIKNKEKWS